MYVQLDDEQSRIIVEVNSSPPTTTGMYALGDAYPIDDLIGAYLDLSLVPRKLPPRPNETSRFDGTQGIWIEERTAEQIAADDRSQLENEINAFRDGRLAEGAMFSAGAYGSQLAVKCNDTELNRISAIALEAYEDWKAGAAVQVVYRDARNVNHTLTAVQAWQWYRGIRSYVTAVRRAAWELKDMATIPTDWRSDSRWPSRTTIPA